MGAVREVGGAERGVVGVEMAAAPPVLVLLAALVMALGVPGLAGPVMEPAGLVMGPIAARRLMRPLLHLMPPMPLMRLPLTLRLLLTLRPPMPLPPRRQQRPQP